MCVAFPVLAELRLPAWTGRVLLICSQLLRDTLVPQFHFMGYDMSKVDCYSTDSSWHSGGSGSSKDSQHYLRVTWELRLRPSGLLCPITLECLWSLSGCFLFSSTCSSSSSQACRVFHNQSPLSCSVPASPTYLGGSSSQPLAFSPVLSKTDASDPRLQTSSLPGYVHAYSNQPGHGVGNRSV